MSKVTLLKFGIYILVTLALVLVIMQFLSVNQTPVMLNTYLGPVEGHSLGRLLVVAFLMGAFFGFLAAFLPSLVDLIKIKKLRVQVRMQKNRLKDLEKKQTSMLAHADLPGEQ